MYCRFSSSNQYNCYRVLGDVNVDEISITNDRTREINVNLSAMNKSGTPINKVFFIGLCAFTMARI